MASSQLPDTTPEKRIEPGILTDLRLDDDSRAPAEPAAHRMLSVTLLISVFAHVIILALAAYAAKRDTLRPEAIVAQPSIQIRFRQNPQPPAPRAEQQTTTEPVMPSGESAAPVEETAAAQAILPAETITAEPDAAPAESIAEIPAPTPPRIQAPSLTDLRTAARNRAEQDRRSRSTHPDCLTRERRNAYLDCGDEQAYDYTSAGQNDTVAFFTPTLPAEPDNGVEEITATGARVKAAIDMFDNQLGTTQTKKRIMNFP
ncbi:hypothetical protein [Pseudohongiella sp.]|uniref:Uncharacterized protein n=1 Tax=marine sediment metagenome TaxID=412755 RepID=A0A0F9YGZ7_9ZZZZ|nr:hypothetical protein [Pseudohongiella sp.]HDZ09252.1 hypothetical protein [Pseudohongiella sp.]HEA62116.1 hypothetical protein [Pseudohongiella sp.]